MWVTLRVRPTITAKVLPPDFFEPITRPCPPVANFADQFTIVSKLPKSKLAARRSNCASCHAAPPSSCSRRDAALLLLRSLAPQRQHARSACAPRSCCCHTTAAGRRQRNRAAGAYPARAGELQRGGAHRPRRRALAPRLRRGGGSRASVRVRRPQLLSLGRLRVASKSLRRCPAGAAAAAPGERASAVAMQRALPHAGGNLSTGRVCWGTGACRQCTQGATATAPATPTQPQPQPTPMRAPRCSARSAGSAVAACGASRTVRARFPTTRFFRSM